MRRKPGVDLVEAGIIDPTKAVTVELENAVSATLTEAEEDKDTTPALG
jgi:hypothetical protein